MEQFEAKESSNIAGARYEPDTQTLCVDFKGKEGKSTSSYEFKYFPLPAWEAFRDATRKGGYFAKEIRPFYKGVKVVPTPSES